MTPDALVLADTCGSVVVNGTANLTAACPSDPLLDSGVLEAQWIYFIVRILCGLLVAPWFLAGTAGFVVWVTKSIPTLIFRRKTLPQQLETSIWTIHGKTYDLSSWVKDHPGGVRAIELGRNRDCTGLFESYHVFSDKAKVDKILARFEVTVPKEQQVEVGSNSTGLDFCDPFHEDVKAMLREHFKDKSHKAKPFTACMLVALVVSEVILAYQFMLGSNVALVLLPIVGWLLCCNLGHDGSHFSISSRPWLNTLAAHGSMPLFFPPTSWNVQHVVQHHVYTNDEDDVDLYHFLPVCRTSRLTSWTSVFSLQWLAIFAVLPTTVGHLMYVVPLDLLTGQRDAVTGTKRYQQCQNLADFVARHQAAIGLELLACFAFLALSLYVQGFAVGLPRVFLCYSIASYCFIIITQGAHLQNPCHFDKSTYSSWAKRQAATSVNFSPSSSLWCFLTGGLNVQSLHHVVPIVGSSHYTDIYPKYKEVCRKHGIELKEANGVFDFFRGFLDWIRELASEEPGSTELKAMEQVPAKSIAGDHRVASIRTKASACSKVSDLAAAATAAG